jgi:glucose-6-phosphate 1-epimerase
LIALPKSVELRAGHGGLPMLYVQSSAGSGEIYLHGGHVASWTPAGAAPVLWTSSASKFDLGFPIRGGVPICFPWFGMKDGHPDAPLHGFARISPWQLVKVDDSFGSVTVQLRLTDSAESRASAWPHRFELLYTVTFGSELRLSIDVSNSDDNSGFGFEAALHNYYAVANSRKVIVSGLEGHDFIANGDASVVRENTPVCIGEGVSRRYLSANEAVIHDDGNARSIHIHSTGATGAVLWNPGAETAKAMADFTDGEWTKTVCFETCNIDGAAVWLNPGETHSMTAVISVTTPSRPLDRR